MESLMRLWTRAFCASVGEIEEKNCPWASTMTVCHRRRVAGGGGEGWRLNAADVVPVEVAGGEEVGIVDAPVQILLGSHELGMGVGDHRRFSFCC